MPSIRCPCKDCPDKGCGAYHCECGMYLAYVEAVERVRQVRNGFLHTFSPSPQLIRNVRKKLNRTKQK